MTVIQSQVINILASYSSLPCEQILLTAPLENIGIDSLALVEIIFDIEEQFDISVPDESTLASKQLPLSTVQDVLNLVNLLLNEQNYA